MANVTQTSYFQEAKNKFLKLLDEELVFDKEVDSWFLISSTWPVVSIIVIYLVFIYKVGPDMMKNRQPYKLKHIMLCYNLFQTVFNLYISSLVFITPGVLNYLWNNSCHPLEKSKNIFLINEFNNGMWYYILSKFIDLLDTIFFVLRKKDNQVTFLHVYHHSNMFISSWSYLKFFKGQQMLVPGTINAFIHVVMYSYYFLAALGPQMKPYLWWKKYLTTIQIIQFLIILLWYIGLISLNCNTPKLYMYYMLANVTFFLYLFSSFYKKMYIKRPKADKIKKT